MGELLELVGKKREDGQLSHDVHERSALSARSAMCQRPALGFGTHFSSEHEASQTMLRDLSVCAFQKLIFVQARSYDEQMKPIYFGILNKRDSCRLKCWTNENEN